MLKGGYDIISMLENRGLSRNDAIYINSVIKSSEIPFLINSLLSENTESEEELRYLLYEYGIDLEEKYKNCEILDEKDIYFKKYGFNVKSQYSNELNDLLEYKNIPVLISGPNIYFTVPDDITLYMIDNFITEKDDDMSKYTKISGSRLDEKVIGFSNDIERKRLAKLAGIKEDFGDFGITDDGAISADSIDDVPAIDDNQIDNNVMDVTDVPVQSDVVPTTNSEAMNSILDFLNSIQTQLPDVRLSEYKTLVIKVNDLANQVKSMGGSYLGERNMKG